MSEVKIYGDKKLRFLFAATNNELFVTKQKNLGAQGRRESSSPH